MEPIAHPMPALSIIVPAYNEERRIGATLQRIVEYMAATDETYELIVVDDGSRDRTSAIVRSFASGHDATRLVAMPHNAGKGAAVRAGVLASRGRDVLFSDADLSTPITELARLRVALDAGADVAIGSRTLAGDVLRTQRPLRRLQGTAFHLVTRLLGFRVVTAIADTQCGFKLFRGPVARLLFAQLTLDGFAFDVELLELAHRRFQIAEVAVEWTHADGSKVRPGLDAVKMLGELLRIRFAGLRRSRAQLALRQE